MTKFFELLKRHPVLIGILAVGLAVLSTFIPQNSYFARFAIRVFMCGTMLFLVYLVSGEKTLSKGNYKTGYVIKSMMGLLIIAALMGAFNVWTKISRDGVAEGFMLRMLILALMFLAGCLFEELCFRAVLNDAIFYQFKNVKGVFVISAVVTSLVFGAVHVIGSPLTSALEWAQAGMKTLSSAVFGFALLIMYWKTRNIWACGLVHAAYDFLTEVALAFGSEVSIGAGSYVAADATTAIASIIVLGVNTLIGALITWHVWRKVGRTIDFEELRRTW